MNDTKLILVKFIDGTSETIEAYYNPQDGYYGYLTNEEFKALPPYFNHITVTFNKKLYDGTLHRFNYAFELCLLENLDTRQLPEYFEYVFFDKILEYFIECEKEAFSAEEFL